MHKPATPVVPDKDHGYLLASRPVKMQSFVKKLDYSLRNRVISVYCYHNVCAAYRLRHTR
jgi:hypothetical protein